MSEKRERKLTPKQERFVDEYLIDLNATAAAKRAGYSAKSAEKIGFDLLKKTQVAEAISEKKERRAERSRMTADDVVRALERQYEICSRSYQKLDFEGNPIFDDQGRPVLRQVDAAAANKALDMLMKHHGGYERNNKQELSGGIAFVWSEKTEE